MVPFEIVRGQVAKAGVRAHGVDVLSPCLDGDLGLPASTEPLDAQALVTGLAVEGLVDAVLPMLPGVDDGRLDMHFGQPLQDSTDATP